MNDTVEVSGRCLCGAVRLSVHLHSPVVDACHCDMCRRWSGGPIMAVEAGDNVTFQGEQHITVYDSSDWAQRGFCRHCGTHLFYRLKAPTHYALPVGVLDDGPAWRFEKEIFVDEQPDYYRFANDTRRMTGPEVIEEFGQP